MDSISGEGHQWPDASRLNQSNEVWAFFKQFSLNSTTAITQQKFSLAHEPIAISYSSGIVRIQGASEKNRVLVIDTKGREVAATSAAKGQFTFKDKPSGVYMVLVSGTGGTFALRMVVP
jgi:ferredoxin-NADP reductase